MINRTMRLLGSNGSHLQVLAALTAMADVMRVSLVRNRLLFLHSKYSEIFAIIICDPCREGFDNVWVCKGGMRKKV